MSSEYAEKIVYDFDIYELTSVERSSVENVVWDSNQFVAYVQWSNGDSKVYCYNVNQTQWNRFVGLVNHKGSVGSALREANWGPAFNTLWEFTFAARVPVDTNSAVEVGAPFEVVLSFTGQITFKINADDINAAIDKATAFFKNDATSGEIEVLSAKKVN